MNEPTLDFLLDTDDKIEVAALRAAAEGARDAMFEDVGPGRVIFVNSTPVRFEDGEALADLLRAKAVQAGFAPDAGVAVLVVSDVVEYEDELWTGFRLKVAQ